MDNILPYESGYDFSLFFSVKKVYGSVSVEISSNVPPGDTFTLRVPALCGPARLDAVIASLVPSYSRSFFQSAIEGGFVTVNGQTITKSSTHVKELDVITITFPPKRSIDRSRVIEALESKNLSIDVVYEHEHFLIVYKPANILVHAPSERSSAVTLVDWLLVNYPDIAQVGYNDRPGIVHRIDKDTSGLLIIPRTPHAHHVFSLLFKERAIGKTYLAVVTGHPQPSGTINIPIGRSPQGNKMAAFPEYAGQSGILRRDGAARSAVTHFCVKHYFAEVSLIEASIITGRTHQIRVHCAAIGHPIVGDPIYGTKSKLIGRQALHAHSLSFLFDGTKYSFTKEVPDDFRSLVEKLKKGEPVTLLPPPE